MTATTTTLLTYDDWLALPEDGPRYELIAGELIVAAAPTWDHGTVLRNLFRLLDAWVQQTDAGEVRQAPLGVRLSLTSVPEPDMLFIRKERLSELVAQASVMGPPDLVLEVVSPSSVKMDTVTKFALYARHGVAEYWIVNPMNRTIAVHTLVGDRYESLLPDAASLHRSRVLTGLTVDPTVCFAGLISDSSSPE